MNAELSRRRMLAGGLGGGVLLATGVARPAVAAVTGWQPDITANGWPVLSAPKPTRVEGFAVAVTLLAGPVHTVLTHCLRRFLYEIDDMVTQADLTSYSTNRAVSAEFESNYLSGTAFAVRPNRYPLSVGNGFLARDVVIIRDILADCEGTVRWGGDLDPVKESHFQIDVGPSNPRLLAVAAKLDQWRQHPGQGAGAAVDVLDPGRRRMAAALASRQHR